MNVRPATDKGSVTSLTPPGTARWSQYLLTCRAGTAILALGLAVNLCACRTISTYPDPKDVTAATEAKPRPSIYILTDPTADARYNSAIEAWGDRVRAAGVRLCRFHARTGMRIDCP